MVATYADQIIAAAQAAGLSAQVVGTGGGCEAIEIRKEGAQRHALVTNGDAMVPGTYGDGDDEVVIGVYVDGDADEPLSLSEGMGLPPEAVMALAVGALSA